MEVSAQKPVSYYYSIIFCKSGHPSRTQRTQESLPVELGHTGSGGTETE